MKKLTQKEINFRQTNTLIFACLSLSIVFGYIGFISFASAKTYGLTVVNAFNATISFMWLFYALGNLNLIKHLPISLVTLFIMDIVLLLILKFMHLYNNAKITSLNIFIIFLVPILAGIIDAYFNHLEKKKN